MKDYVEFMALKKLTQNVLKAMFAPDIREKLDAVLANPGAYWLVMFENPELPHGAKGKRSAIGAGPGMKRVTLEDAEMLTLGSPGAPQAAVAYCLTEAGEAAVAAAAESVAAPAGIDALIDQEAEIEQAASLQAPARLAMPRLLTTALCDEHLLGWQTSQHEFVLPFSHMVRLAAAISRRPLGLERMAYSPATASFFYGKRPLPETTVVMDGGAIRVFLAPAVEDMQAAEAVPLAVATCTSKVMFLLESEEDGISDDSVPVGEGLGVKLWSMPDHSHCWAFATGMVEADSAKLAVYEPAALRRLMLIEEILWRRKNSQKR